jgi:hypothetical protein
VAFGQYAGPPASGRQIQELLELLRGAGHSDFRDARGPLGLTQRQAAGKFTRDEAESLIEQLQEAEHSGAPAPEAGPPPPRLSAAERSLRAMPTPRLAAELQRRGWIVMEP